MTQSGMEDGGEKVRNVGRVRMSQPSIRPSVVNGKPRRFSCSLSHALNKKTVSNTFVCMKVVP